MSRKRERTHWLTLLCPKRLLKSQCSDFVFKRDCLLCGNVCKMKDSKNPHRWVQVRQCKTVTSGSAITFKQQLENLCDEREDMWGEWGNSETKWGSWSSCCWRTVACPLLQSFTYYTRDSSLDHGNFGGGPEVRPLDYGWERDRVMDNLRAVRHVRSSLGHCVETTVCVQRHGPLRWWVACAPHRGLRQCSWL